MDTETRADVPARRAYEWTLCSRSQSSSTSRHDIVEQAWQRKSSAPSKVELRGLCASLPPFSSASMPFSTLLPTDDHPWMRGFLLQHPAVLLPIQVQGRLPGLPPLGGYLCQDIFPIDEGAPPPPALLYVFKSYIFRVYSRLEGAMSFTSYFIVHTRC